MFLTGQSNNQILARHIAAGSLTDQLGTLTGNLVLDAASGHNYIELHSAAANTKKWRFYNGQSWNPDALLIYDVDGDSTALTIEAGKLGVSRGANSLSHTLDVGGNVAISGTEIITSGRNLTNIGTISSGAISSTGTLSAIRDVSRSTFTGTGVGELHVSGGADASSSDVSSITFSTNNTSNAGAIIGSQLTNVGTSLFFGTSNSYAAGVTNTGLILDHLGRAGISTTTNYAGSALAYQLTVDSAGASGSVFEAHRTANSRVEMYQNSTGGFYIDALGTTPFLQLRTGGSNRLLIDNAGRHYIGKGASDLATSGIELNPGGYLQVTESQSPSLYLSRITDDGNIINFYKTANLMGQIGTYGGAFYIGGGTGSNGGGLMFNGTDIEPTTGSTGRTDGAIDLGSSSYRFQHLRFSGGLYGGSEVQLTRLGLGNVEAGSSVGHTASENEGIFWHNSKASYGIWRTSGAWSGSNYSQLKLDWDTGIIIDGGTDYGKSGVKIEGPVSSTNGGMVLQTKEAYGNTATSISSSASAVICSTTITVLANSKLAVWAHSGQIQNTSLSTNANMLIQLVDSSSNVTNISDHNGNHYWWDQTHNIDRQFITGQGISAALAAGTYTVRILGGAYGATVTMNFQNQGSHMIIQEISEAL